MKKKKIIRLTESDIENLVKKIIKEDFEWAQEIEQAPDVFAKRIDNWDEFVHYGKGTRWAPAYRDIGEKYYDMYVEKYGNFTIYIDKDSKMKVACLGDGSACFREDDMPIKPEEAASLFKIKSLDEVPLNESTYDFDWDSVLGNSDDKYHTLEKEVSGCIEPLIEKYKSDFGNDSYAVIDAILQIVDGMFQKIR
jgi:hypothetical protein